MNEEILSALTRIEVDIAFVRKAFAKTISAPKKGKPVTITIPVLAKSYAPAEAAVAHQQIESAYQAGLITYDKKRGMKRSVTVATIGWTPDKKAAK
jgi:hypothetical protein